MKTQILRLEPHDDIISARDKMEWSQTGRILLVWPERGRILNRRIDLVLLQRHSQSLGAQLAFVTRHPEICYYADELGVPVFKDLRQAQRSHWRVDRRKRLRKDLLPASPHPHPANLDKLRHQAHPAQNPWLTSPVTRIALFSLSMLALLSIAAIMLPGAVITMTPRSQLQQISLEVRGDPILDAINLSGAIPSRPISIVIKGEQSTPAKGFGSIPDQSATVDLLITNLADQAISIPKGTIVRTPGTQPARFSTVQIVQIPAGAGQIVSISARSLVPGVGGNVPAESLIIIEGPLGPRLTATNPLPASGGSNRPALAPKAYQKQQLYEQLVQHLSQLALQELASQTRPGDLLLTPTLTLTQVINQEYDPPQDQPADRLNLVLTLKFQVQVASEEDMRSLAAGVLDANIPDGQHAIPQTVSIENLSEPILGKDQLAYWRMLATQQIQANLEETQATNLIRGLAPASAIDRLRSSLPLETQPSIRLFPGWWPRLPLLPFRITIKSQVNEG